MASVQDFVGWVAEYVKVYPLLHLPNTRISYGDVSRARTQMEKQLTGLLASMEARIMSLEEEVQQLKQNTQNK